MTTPVADYDTAVNQRAAAIRDRLLLDIALVHRDDLAVERARYDLMAAAFDQAVRQLAEEKLGREKETAELRAALTELDNENRRLVARANLAPLGRQIRTVLRGGTAAIGIKPEPYDERADEIGGSKRHLDQVEG